MKLLSESINERKQIKKFQIELPEKTTYKELMDCKSAYKSLHKMYDLMSQDRLKSGMSNSPEQNPLQY